jgi:hypothetical protein
MPYSIAKSLVLSLCLAAPCVAAAAPADVVTVGSGSAAPGGAIDVPVYIRDTSGTAVGIDQPAGSRIQAYSITVGYAPSADVQSITFTRGGITAPLTPSFEAMPSSAGSVTLIDTFSEATNLIPFTSDAALPGNQIGTLHVVLAASASAGDTITLTLDAALTQLSNEAGTTSETTTATNLVLANGQIVVTASTPVRLQEFDVR